jgi:probable HAF family extracellular repeat protein
VLAAGPQIHAQTAPSYTVKDLGNLGNSRNPNSAGQAINNSGQVVGRAMNANDTSRATLFSGTGSNNKDLGSLTGDLQSQARGINDAGAVVGVAVIPGGLSRATLFSGTGTGNVNLGFVLGPPVDTEQNSSSEAYGINNSGLIVGRSTDVVFVDNYSYLFATLFSTTNQDLGTLGGYSGGFAYAINSRGEVVGVAPTTTGLGNATLFGTSPQFNMSLSQYSSEARDINDSGLVVGYVSTSTGPHATTFHNGAAFDLGVHDSGTHIGGSSISTSVNGAGQVVGYFTDVTNPSTRYPFLYTKGVMYDITDLTGTAYPDSLSIVDNGHTINDWGQIAATKLTYATSLLHAVLLNPVEPLSTLATTGAVSRNTKLIDGMSYGKFTPTVNTANLLTTVSFLDGTAGSGGSVPYSQGGFGKNRDLTATFSAGDPNALASDKVTVAGTGADTFVIQLSYDEAKANGLFGNEQNAAIGWLDGNNQWVLAATGDSTGTPFFAGNRSYNAATDLHPGYYGVDTANNVVWAVVDHAGAFGVFKTNNVATAPQAALSPAALAFGSIASGNTSAAQTITLSNPGTATLNLSGIAIAGANASQFHETHSCGATLAAGASCTISVTFAPTTGAAASATLSVADDATGSPHTTSLSGTGTTNTPQATLSPTSANYGSLTTGTSATRTFTLTNGGNASLPITSAGISGTNATLFTITTNTCGASLAAGGNCSITVAFAPTAAGAAAAMLSVYDTVGTQTAALTGAGTAPAAPLAALTPLSGAFGSVTVGSASTAQVFTLANAGNAVLPITSVSLAGANASSFRIATNACGSTLAAGASCAISLTFNPSAAGSASASLTVVDSVGTQTAALSGTGVALAAADFSIASTSATQTVQRGSSVSYTLQVLSTIAGNPFTSPVTFAASGLPTGASATFSSPSVVPGVGQAATTSMTITVPAAVASLSREPRSPFTAVAGIVSFASLLFLYPTRRRRRSFGLLVLLLASLGCAVGLSGCGDGAAATDSTITVTGTSGNITHSTTVTLTVK